MSIVVSGILNKIRWDDNLILRNSKRPLEHTPGTPKYKNTKNQNIAYMYFKYIYCWRFTYICLMFLYNKCKYISHESNGYNYHHWPMLRLGFSETNPWKPCIHRLSQHRSIWASDPAFHRLAFGGSNVERHFIPPRHTKMGGQHTTPYRCVALPRFFLVCVCVLYPWKWSIQWIYLQPFVLNKLSFHPKVSSPASSLGASNIRIS